MLAAALLHIYGLPFMYCIQQLLNIYNVFKLTVIANVFNIEVGGPYTFHCYVIIFWWILRHWIRSP